MSYYNIQNNRHCLLFHMSDHKSSRTDISALQTFLLEGVQHSTTHNRRMIAKKQFENEGM